MTKETALQNVGGKFWLANERCEVTTVDSFGGVVHYGFIVLTGRNAGLVGWVPTNLIGGTEL